MIPFEARFHVGEATSEQEDRVFAIARAAENDLLRVERTELADEQGYLGGTFIDFIPRGSGLAGEVVQAMCDIYEDKELLSALNSVEGISVTPIGY